MVKVRIYFDEFYEYYIADVKPYKKRNYDINTGYICSVDIKGSDKLNKFEPYPDDFNSITKEYNNQLKKFCIDKETADTIEEMIYLDSKFYISTDIDIINIKDKQYRTFWLLTFEKEIISKDILYKI